MKARTGEAVQTRVVGEGLPQLKRQFDQWRAGRKVGERIPPQLWDGAVSAAVEHGAYRVARELHLDYAVLKRRAALAGGQGTGHRVGGAALRRAVRTGRAVDAGAGLRTRSAWSRLANARGAKMRVELRGNGLSGLPALCNAFWAA